MKHGKPVTARSTRISSQDIQRKLQLHRGIQCHHGNLIMQELELL
jgi:hypothetical protein